MIKEEIKKYLERKENESSPKCMGHSKSSSINKREVYTNKILPQETRKSSNNLILHLKQLEKKVPTLGEGKKS